MCLFVVLYCALIRSYVLVVVVAGVGGEQNPPPFVIRYRQMRERMAMGLQRPFVSRHTALPALPTTTDTNAHVPPHDTSMSVIARARDATYAGSSSSNTWPFGTQGVSQYSAMAPDFRAHSDSTAAGSTSTHSDATSAGSTNTHPSSLTHSSSPPSTEHRVGSRKAARYDTEPRSTSLRPTPADQQVADDARDLVVSDGAVKSE